MNKDNKDRAPRIPLNAGKDPSFRFYPKDWIGDLELQSCSLAAQGLFMKMLCFMFQSSQEGYLLLNGSIPPNRALYNALSIHYKTFNKLVKELLNAGPLKQDENGVYYSARMVRDKALKETRRAAGKLGGNPILDNQKVKQEVNQDLKPYSGSGSGSPSGEEKIKKKRDSFRTMEAERQSSPPRNLADFQKSLSERKQPTNKEKSGIGKIPTPKLPKCLSRDEAYRRADQLIMQHQALLKDKDRPILAILCRDYHEDDLSRAENELRDYQPGARSAGEYFREHVEYRR